jgi:hypothetical protein
MSKQYPALVAVAVSLLAASGAQAQIVNNEQLAARCAQLGGLADRYARKGGEGSSGPTLTRLGAGIDCERGRYDQGIKALETLLSGQRIPFPPR